MRILVTGSAGHLGEALMLTLQRSDHEAIGLDIKTSPVTHQVGSITERDSSNDACRVSTPFCIPPHCTSHTSRLTRVRTFVDTNISGT